MKWFSIALVLVLIFSGLFFVLTKYGKRFSNPHKLRSTARVLSEDASVRLINGKTLREVSQQFEVEKQITIDGVTYVLIKGALYEVLSKGTLAFRQQYYDATHMAASYVTEDGKTYRINPRKPEIRVLMTKHFKEGFEEANTLGDLVLTDERIATLWSRGSKTLTVDSVSLACWLVTLLSPAQPEAARNAADGFARKILKGAASFAGNRLEPSSTVVHSGSRSLHAYALPPPLHMICTKSSLHTEFFHFVKGDHVWFSGWYYFDEGLPFTIMDLESSWLLKSGGIRIAIDGGGRLYVELKALGKPKWRQTASPPAILPRKQWLNIRAHFILDDENGLIELWQDGQPILQGRGATLPLPKAIYNKLEVGVTAATHNRGPVSLYVDDVEISDQPL